MYAAGDVAHAENALFDGELMRLERWTNPRRRGPRPPGTRSPPVGALTVDRPREIMEYRRHIARRAPWAEALTCAAGTAA